MCLPACRRKQAQLQTTLKEMGEEALEEQLQAAGEFPVTPAHRFATLIEVSHPLMVFLLKLWVKRICVTTMFKCCSSGLLLTAAE